MTVRDSAGIEIVEQSRIDVPRIDLGDPYLELGSIDGEDVLIWNQASNLAFYCSVITITYS